MGKKKFKKFWKCLLHRLPNSNQTQENLLPSSKITELDQLFEGYLRDWLPEHLDNLQ